MKIMALIVSLVFLGVINGGCESEAQKKVIQGQQKKIEELAAKLSKVNLEAQERCANAARKFFSEEQWSKDMSASHTNHYNQKLNKCFIRIDALKANTINKSVSSHSFLVDALEGKLYAECHKYASMNQNLANVKPTGCKVLDRDCNTEQEYDTFVKSYMEDS